MGSVKNFSTSAVQLNSDLNRFSPESSQISTDRYPEFTGNHERKMVLEIVDRIFDEKTGIHSVSSSVCLTPEKRVSQSQDYDKRLRYWKDMVEERKRITERIKETIGRPAKDVLFNRSTVDAQEKSMVKRVLDFSERLNPLTLVTKRLIKLREYCQLSTCLGVNELEETIPRPEREEHAVIEISGMPALTKKEQLDYNTSCLRSRWLESKILERRIEEKREDIERVVEFYPDIEHLAVVGEGLLKNLPVKHNSEIELLDEDIIKTVSTETTATGDECMHEVKVPKIEPQIQYGMKVNEHTYIMGMKRSAQYVEIEVRFECHPFETVMKRVLHLENLGQKILNIELVQRNYYPKVQALLRSNDNEFLMDFNPFRLIAGEKRDIVVLYQPRKVDVVKQQWLLKVDPQFFCRKADAIVLKLSGRCKPSWEYAQKIHCNVVSVIEKSNMKMMRKLGNNLGTLTPLIKPNEVVCPYSRILDEREIFEQLNPGYTCERYHDLEMLKDIHKRVKKPREPAWDFKLDTLHELVMRLESPDRRALIFNEILGVLECMKGKPTELETKIDENPERERSRFLYVRGVISAAIEEWEDMAVSIEETFINQALKIHRIHAKEMEEKGSDERSMSPERMLFDADEEELRQLAIKRVRRQKPFRDSLFVQTYTHLCNFIEDIVSVIESTDFE